MEAKTKQEIANEYGVNIKTFNKWLKYNSIDVPRGLIYPVLQMEIYSKLGKPEKLKIKK